MEIKSNINSRPFTPVSPGSILKDELEARSLPVEVFAEKIGLDKLTLEELLKGKLILSSENAKIARFLFSLFKALGIPASFWLSLQSAYEEDLNQSQNKGSIRSFFDKFSRNRVAL